MNLETRRNVHPSVQPRLSRHLLLGRQKVILPAKLTLTAS
jgi:hypothetical protein